MQKVQGWSETGGIAVVVPGTQGSGSQRFQQSFRGATITVYAAGTLTLSSIFSDNLSTPTAQANPFTASSTTGLWSFYAANGRYDIKFSGGGITSPFTLSDVSLFDIDDVTELNIEDLTFNYSLRGIPSTRLGTQVGTVVAGGSMSAGTYKIIVAGVTSLGGVSLAPVDEYATHEISVTISAGNVASGLRSISVTWQGDSTLFSSYYVFYGNTGSGVYKRYVESATTTAVLTVDPVAAPTGLAAVVNNGVPSSLRSNSYFIKVTARFADGETLQADSNRVIAALTAAQDKNATISLSWNAVATATSYRLYISNSTTGGSRQLLYYVDVGLVTNYTYTGQTLTYRPIWDNFDYQSASELVVGSIRSLSDGRSSFAGDLFLGGMYNSDIQLIMDMTDDAGTGNVHCGTSHRFNTAEYWFSGFWSDNQNKYSLRWYLNGTGGGDDLFYLDGDADTATLKPVLQDPLRLKNNVALNSRSSDNAVTVDLVKLIPSVDVAGNVLDQAAFGSDVTTIANLAILSLGAATQGLIVVYSQSDTAGALFFLNGTTHTVNLISDPQSLFSTTATTADKTNVYWSAANARYELENRRTISRTYRINLIGVAAA